MVWETRASGLTYAFLKFQKEEEEWQNKNVRGNNGWKFSEFENTQNAVDSKKDIYGKILKQKASIRHIKIKFL